METMKVMGGYEKRLLKRLNQISEDEHIALLKQRLKEVEYENGQLKSELAYFQSLKKNEKYFILMKKSFIEKETQLKKVKEQLYWWQTKALQAGVKPEV